MAEWHNPWQDLYFNLRLRWDSSRHGLSYLSVEKKRVLRESGAMGNLWFRLWVSREP